MPKWTSEQAREFQLRSVEARKQKLAQRGNDRAEKMLEGLGVSWDDADESLKTLANQAVEGGGGAVTAHRLLLQRLGRDKGDSGPTWDPTKGEPCPTCGGQSLTISLTADDYEKFVQLQETEDA